MSPVEKPQLVVAVFLEHGGHGGSAAGPIARAVVAAHLKPSALKAPQPVPAAQSAEPETDTEED
jgi:penicillin-binding protein 2